MKDLCQIKYRAERIVTYPLSQEDFSVLKLPHMWPSDRRFRRRFNKKIGVESIGAICGWVLEQIAKITEKDTKE